MTVKDAVSVAYLKVRERARTKAVAARGGSNVVVLAERAT
jgi:hypothetical protein